MAMQQFSPVVIQEIASISNQIHPASKSTPMLHFVANYAFVGTEQGGHGIFHWLLLQLSSQITDDMITIKIVVSNDWTPGTLVVKKDPTRYFSFEIFQSAGVIFLNTWWLQRKQCQTQILRRTCWKFSHAAVLESIENPGKWSGFCVSWSSVPGGPLDWKFGDHQERIYTHWSGDFGAPEPILPGNVKDHGCLIGDWAESLSDKDFVGWTRFSEEKYNASITKQVILA